MFTDLAFAPDGERVASASAAGVAVHARAPGGAWSAGEALFGGAAHAVSFGPAEHGSPLAAACADGSVLVWEAASAVDADGVECSARLAPVLRAREAASGAARAARFAPRALGRRLAAGFDDGCVRVYEAPRAGGGEWRLAEEFDAGAGPVLALAWAPAAAGDAALLAVVGARGGGDAALWAASAGGAWALAADLRGGGAGGGAGGGVSGAAASLAWAPRAGAGVLTLAVAGGADGAVALWRVAPDGAPAAAPAALTGAGAALVALRARGATLSATPLARLVPHGGAPVVCAAWTPAGALVTSAADGAVVTTDIWGGGA
jgi:hypothetical protein